MTIISILIRLLVMLIFYLLPDIFIHSAVKSAFNQNKKRILRIYWIFNFVILFIAIAGFTLNRFLENDLIRINLYLFGIFVAFLFTKIIVAVFLLMEDTIRIPRSLIKKYTSAETQTTDKTGLLIPRRKFISQSILAFASIPFGGFIYGMVKGRYDFTIHRETIFFDDLPKAFDGVTITQISDLHIGSWDHFSKPQLEYMVNELNALNSDFVCFTGDIVNSRADEMNGWYDTFKTINARTGKLSILGNHDYGDYVNWNSEAERSQNLEQVKNIHPQIGFQLLLNEKMSFEKDGEYLHFAGIENWGAGDFPKLGDLDKAASGLSEKDFIVLLSHDPSFWEEHALKHASKPQLTLSGHTHGFQMGVEIPGFRFSPSQWVYTQWAGIYQKGKQFIYVNRGLGTVGYPGRLGIWPEITQLTLKRSV